MNVLDAILYYKSTVSEHSSASKTDKDEFISPVSYLKYYEKMVEMLKGIRLVYGCNYLLGNIYFCVFKYKHSNDMYFCFRSLSEHGLDEDSLLASDITRKDFSSINVLPAIYFLKLSIRKGISPDYLSNQILYQHQDEEYSGHEHLEVLQMFEPAFVVKVPKSSPMYSEDARDFRMAALYILSNHVDVCNSLLWSVRSIFDSSIFGDVHFFRSLAAVQALTSHHITHSFLEVFKCIEYIYALPRCLELKKQIRLHDSKALALEIVTKNTLGWERKEADSVSRLFSLWSWDIVSSSNAKIISLKVNQNLESKTLKGVVVFGLGDAELYRNEYLDRIRRIELLISGKAKNKIFNKYSRLRFAKILGVYKKFICELNSYVDTCNKGIGSYLYHIRCNIAHLGKDDNIQQESDWTVLIRLLIDFLNDFYAKYKDDII